MQLPLASGALLLRLISYNIRFAATNRGTGEQPWSGVRAPRVVNELRFHTLHSPESFLGLQEVLKSQLDDILNGLNSEGGEWSSVGVGRNDGAAAGEFSPILYRNETWELTGNETLWLSPTPEEPGSTGWGARLPRILTIGSFRHRETGQEITALNTHFDHESALSRQNSARLITDQINSLLESSSTSPAIILTGDLNSEPGQEAYRFLSQSSSPISDASQALPQSQRYGFRDQTFSGFQGRSSAVLDYVFLNKARQWRVWNFGVPANQFDEGFYYSDHQAVVVDVELR